MAEHTPTPKLMLGEVHVYEAGSDEGYVPTDDAVVHLDGDEDSQIRVECPNAPELAALIVRAVNSHDALLAVEKAARAYFTYAVQDEAAERDVCVDDEQHERAKALESALASAHSPEGDASNG